MFSLAPMEILKHPPTRSVAFYKKIVGTRQCDLNGE